MTVPRRLVFDTTCLAHFAKIDRVDVLGCVLIEDVCTTTEFVRAELRNGARAWPALIRALEAPWLGVDQLDTIQALLTFERWTRRIGAGERDMGEASVFAAAELAGGTAITDDRNASQVARNHGLDVHGTLWLLASACKSGKLVEVEATNLIDMLTDSGLRLPCTGSEFPSWARRHHLL